MQNQHKLMNMIRVVGVSEEIEKLLVKEVYSLICNSRERRESLMIDLIIAGSNH